MSVTDEELAMVASLVETIRAFHNPVDMEHLYLMAPRLIAALKAERAEVERLKKIINEYRSRTVSYRVDL